MAAGVPGPYSGVSTLAFVSPLSLRPSRSSRSDSLTPSWLIFSLSQVARASALAFGVVYGSMKLSYLKAKAKSHKKAEAKDHH
ncbi:hypothetical protein J5N97_023866 [Dioscorea zingiberensis]|uniref:ATP synthase subunit e, mitochondrial n=1 Tax=Dioscorea zingiberensis TaxID=325984 RepID=A0A9D5H887_9LILI|nr:hypothetical protein J5N97_023866 [Dioscorea zingiberensis]